jgi:hypothetical protein
MASAVKASIPPLSPGEKLTREEFLRRWDAHPEIKNAELIAGVVYMPSPVSREHSIVMARVTTWLGTYAASTPGTESGADATCLLLNDSPQPDVNLHVLPEYGGKTGEEGIYVEGPPELVAEICYSSASYDLHVKRDLYQAAHVPEYLAILLQEQEIRWQVLVNGKYELLPPDADGLWRSRTFPGLCLDGKALLAGDMQKVLARLQEGIASPGHKQFVADLAARKAARGQI